MKIFVKFDSFHLYCVGVIFSANSVPKSCMLIICEVVVCILETNFSFKFSVSSSFI